VRHAHRWVLAVPFLVLLLTTLIGGQLNSVDARGRVIDDSTGLPVAGVSITYGQNRGAVSAEDGSYEITNLPRGARLKTSKPGYPPQTPAAEVTEIRLVPGSLSLQVNEEGTTDTRVPGVEVRQGDKLLTKCNAEPCGQMVIDLTSGIVGQKALVCAPAHESKEIDLKGVTLVMTLQPKEGSACPPLPTPSPSPAPSPSPSVPPASPTPSASP
jgi:carboxypeptidase family protein